MIFRRARITKYNADTNEITFRMIIGRDLDLPIKKNVRITIEDEK